jgi:hypothetical protein
MSARRKSLLTALVAAVIAGGVFWASAANMLFTAPIGPGSTVPLGAAGAQGSSAAPICSNALDFSQGCNSQYLFLLLY